MSELDRDHNQIVDMFHVSSDEPFSDIRVRIVDNQIPRGSIANFGANKRWKIKLTVIP
jgi:hypothetical protein